MSPQLLAAYDLDRRLRDGLTGFAGTAAGCRFAGGRSPGSQKKKPLLSCLLRALRVTLTHVRVHEISTVKSPGVGVLAGLAGILGSAAVHPLRRLLRDVPDRQRAARRARSFRHDVVSSDNARPDLCFVGGVRGSHRCERRHFWVASSHGPTCRLPFSLVAATAVDIVMGR